jgi:activator of 2-hydroxyglutaryl-CoA dehydratase
MATAVRNHLQTDVNVPSPDTVQFVAAHGAAILGLRRLEKLGTEGISRAADVA